MSYFEVCPVGTLQRLAQVEAQRDALRADYSKVCKLVADMHASATGRPGEGPRLGVIEDVTAVRVERDALLSLIADDAFASSFQTMAQYRSALLNSVKAKIQ